MQLRMMIENALGYSRDLVTTAFGLLKGSCQSIVCGYILGVYMELVIRDRICIFEFYENGEKTSEKRAKF